MKLDCLHGGKIMQDVYQLLSARNIGIAMFTIFAFVYCIFFVKVKKMKVMTFKESVAFWVLFAIVLAVGMFVLISGATGLFSKTWAIAMFLFMALTLKILLRSGQKYAKNAIDSDMSRG